MVKQYFVDVWHGDMRVPATALQQLTGLLTDDERCKAEVFKSALLRDRYLAVRGLLRQILAGYLDVEPSSLAFETGRYGKPALIGYALHFNLSHSADTLLLAVADFAGIGVDIETFRPRQHLDRLAERCFSHQEYQDWCQLSADARFEVFYRLWTKKEAFVKAVGRGIALGIEQCEFQLEKGGQLLAIPPEYGSANTWLVHELDVDDASRAALVTPACYYDLRLLALPID
ncbi:4'-phosphopantetheinyl transferase family protein [Methylomonas sp. MK1]|uniref:4'-phosphopantetheinyl transferase family protein n=1 Tax=Methylomonas sp. MK1 TaxID=1131552 RepID=UPI0003723FEC|nr:4'-phosphopantetheinyl transferase superfamily protein [Methylomonas sp. MK1]